MNLTRKPQQKIIIYTISLLLLISIIWVVFDIKTNNDISVIPAKPSIKLIRNENKALFALHNNQPFDFSTLEETYQYLNNRYDTSDFSLPSLTRILYEHSEKLPEDDFKKLKKTLLDFKYWMDQPGMDSMCYWSENHQILFASAEYLIAQRFENSTFTNDGLSGEIHKQNARKRILIWLEQRWLYGFSEWYSPVYYLEDVAALTNLIDFADEEISIKSKIILDLLLYDVATQSFQNTFISTNGRSYEGHKKHGYRGSMNSVIEDIFSIKINASKKIDMSLNFSYMKNYATPEVIKSIFKDDQDVIIKASNGLDISELQSEHLIGINDNQIMMQLAMEAFTNSEVVNNTINYFDQHNMFSNEFLHDLKDLRINILRKLNLLPIITKTLNPVSNGIALQRANTYTYRTNDYLIATAQSYHPGDYADQQHIWNATLNREVSIFTTHPAKSLSDKGALSSSPGYWVGSGRLPLAVQHENIVLIMYQIPDKPGFLENNIYDYTHAHFPKDKMDETIIENNYAFARVGNKYVAFTAQHALNYAENSQSDLIQNGQNTFWIFEASNQTQEKDFESFISRIKSNSAKLYDNQLTYTSNQQTLSVVFSGDFKVNNQIINTQYSRFDSPYATTQRQPLTITIEHHDHSLYLDFYNQVRQVSHAQ